MTDAFELTAVAGCEFRTAAGLVGPAASFSYFSFVLLATLVSKSFRLVRRLSALGISALGNSRANAAVVFSGADLESISGCCFFRLGLTAGTERGAQGFVQFSELVTQSSH
jgi:hypothetical protein